MRDIVTLYGVTKQSMSIHEIEINALDRNARERIEVTGSKLSDFTTVNRPAISELKKKYEHMKNKTFYYTENGCCTIHLIIGDKTFSQVRTEAVCKGEEIDPVVEETRLGRLVHGGDDYTDDKCMFVRGNSDCERLFSLDVLGVEDRRNTGSEILNDFTENIVRLRWIPGPNQQIPMSNRVESA